MLPSSDIINCLNQVGTLFRGSMLDWMANFNYPGGDSERGFTSIQDATSVKPAQKLGEGTYSVQIWIDLRKAPYAWAYEKGSGLRGPAGAKYPIKPVNASAMVFGVADWPQWEPWPPPKSGAVPWNGKFTLYQVMHPGVEAKPYIRPTINSIQTKVRELLARDFKVTLLRGIGSRNF